MMLHPNGRLPTGKEQCKHGGGDSDFDEPVWNTL